MIYHVIQGILLNLSSLTFQQIWELASRVKACLSYGMALTLTFRQFGVALEGETTRVLKHSNAYNDQSLYRIGFRGTQVGEIER